MTWLLRTINWHRRSIAALLAALGVVAFLSPFPGSADSTRTVVVLNADVVAGQALGAADVSLVAAPDGSLPDAALRDVAEAVGRPVAVSLSRGSILQASLLVDGSAPRAGRCLVPITVHDEQVRALLLPGTRIALVSAVAEVPGVMTRDAVVYPLPRPSETSLVSTGRAAVVLVEVPDELAAEVAILGQSGQLTVVLT